jgi:hypothetical protein
MRAKSKIWMMTAAVAVLAMTSSCSSVGRQARPDGPLPDSAYSSMGTGTVYLLVGKPGSGNVWQIDLKTRHSQQITHNPSEYGVSWISASVAGLALADARSGIDNISIYRDHQSRDLAGHGGTPAISATGLVAYVEVPNVVSHNGPQSWRIGTTASAGGGQTRVLYQQDQPDLGVLAYGPNGDLAVISGPGPHAGQATTPQVVVLGSDGTVKNRIDPKMGDIGFLAWNDKAKRIAVGSLSGHEELIDPTSGAETALPTNWTPQCWGPDGQDLLVTQQDRLGIWRASNPGQIINLGTLSGNEPLTGCSWLATPAANTGGR